ncbi:MAG TPA: hypothetical protein VMU92_14410 [Acidobacteriaceae bacterium]|nr:hypothetical protein [Acidobacteriaceae bacterium]
MKRPSHRRTALAISGLLVFMAGCGVGQYGATSASGAYTIASSASSVNSNGQIRFSAQTPLGDAAEVVWSVAGGDNAPSLGEGHISASGVYTPPSALSQDAARIEIAAHLKSNPLEVASTVVRVTPGFVQSLLPENAALTGRSTLEATAEIAEVNAGDVHWSITGDGAALSDLGTLSDASCQRSLDQYTTCKVSYTAPATAVRGTIYLHATVDGTATTAPLKIALNDGVNSTPVTNQTAQTGAILLGSSGGNDNDFDTYLDANGEQYVADCCGGTLGALVKDSGGNEYILSNNHVLAESDQGKVGDTIDEPGMIDDGCVPLSHAGSTLRRVGTLKYVVPLASKATDVDAALAAVAQGAVDPSGKILQLASPVHPAATDSQLGAAAPVAGDGEVLTASNLNGLRLAKSGRTTGLTCSTVAAVDLSIKVDYYKDCAETQPYYTKIYTGQIGIAGNRFSDSGDSGALVVDASNAEPVGLFFAGGTDGRGHGLSIANPIGEVLRELGTQAGSDLSIVGTATPHAVACLRYDAKTTPVVAPIPAAARTRANFLAETAGAKLVDPKAGILGVRGGGSLDDSGTPALVVYVSSMQAGARVPATVNGMRTMVIVTDASALARDAAPKVPVETNGLQLSADALANTKSVVSANAPRLLQNTAIFGVGVGQSLDNPTDPALLVLVDPAATPQAMPATIGGLRVRYMPLHRFQVTKSKYAGVNPAPSCALQKIVAGSDRGSLHR